MGKAFLEHDETADTAIAILKGVYALKPMVQVYDVFQCLVALGMVFPQHGFHCLLHFVGRRCLSTSDLVGESLIFAYGKPFMATVGCAGFQHEVQIFKEGLGEPLLGMVYDEVDTAKVIAGLDDVVHIDALIGNTYRIGLEDIACLVVSQATALDMVRVVCEVYLRTMIYASCEAHLFLLA